MRIEYYRKFGYNKSTVRDTNHRPQEVSDMKRYFKTVDNKLVEISKDEADAMEKRNNELFASGDFSKMLEIEIPLVIEQ
jgi:hypothetical protein